MGKNFNQDGQTNRQNDKKMRSDHCHAQPGLAEGQTDCPLVEGNVASQLNRL